MALGPFSIATPPARPWQCSVEGYCATKPRFSKQPAPAQGQKESCLQSPPSLSVRQEAGQALWGASFRNFPAPSCRHQTSSPFPAFLCRASIPAHIRSPAAWLTTPATSFLHQTRRPSQRQRGCQGSASPVTARTPLGRPRCTPLRVSRGHTRSMLAVERWDESRRGPLSEGAMLERLRAEGYSVMRYVFTPGTVFDYHDHSVAKKDCIVSGSFLFRMRGQDVVLGPGDMIEVPAGELHYAEVVGTEPVVFLDASKRS